MADDKPFESCTAAEEPKVRCMLIERKQLLLRAVDVEKLVDEQHEVRAIWEMVGNLDLQAYYAEIGAVQGEAGRPVWDPKVLISLWIYAYSDGVSSAREIARLCEYHPAYQWLTAMEVVNYHTLADFRVEHQAALDRLFIEVLGVLRHQELIDLTRVMHDGTKIKASASDQSFHRKVTLEDHLKEAEEQLKAMGDPHSQALSERSAKAQQRALREKQKRLTEALEELKKLEQSRSHQKSNDKKKPARASTTDPQARVMLGSKGGYAPSYNVQITTDAKEKIIIAMGVTQSSSDAAELEPAITRIEENLGEKPEQMVVDAAYSTQQAIKSMAQKQIDLIAPLPQRKPKSGEVLKRHGVSPQFYRQAFSYDGSTDSYRCPAGKLLRFETEERQGGYIARRYRAKIADCRNCALQAQCCPAAKKGRSLVRMEKSAQLLAFEAKMQTAEAQQIYKQRSAVAEFPHAWIKEKMGLRQFHLRGLIKVRIEALWACLAYNICQWIRLYWRPRALKHA